MRSFLASILCFLLFSFVAINAQSNLTPTNIADLLQEEAVLPTAAEDVVTSYVFPDNAARRKCPPPPIRSFFSFD
jgi:hypothetical protein